MPEQFLCPGSEYILYVNRDRVSFRTSARDVRQQKDHSGIERNTIEEIPTAASRVVPGFKIEALELWQVDWIGRSAWRPR
jgi:hypothetical protein